MSAPSARIRPGIYKRHSAPLARPNQTHTQQSIAPAACERRASQPARGPASDRHLPRPHPEPGLSLHHLFAPQNVRHRAHTAAKHGPTSTPANTPRSVYSYTYDNYAASVFYGSVGMDSDGEAECIGGCANDGIMRCKNCRWVDLGSDSDYHYDDYATSEYDGLVGVDSDGDFECIGGCANDGAVMCKNCR